jgi:hypothetical protein
MTETKTDTIVQVSGFGVARNQHTQCDYMLVALTESGKVLLSVEGYEWMDVSPRSTREDWDERTKEDAEEIREMMRKAGLEDNDD